MKIKAVIFDLDDTLISENEYVKSGFSHVAKYITDKTDQDYSTIYDILIKLFEANPRNVFNRLLDYLNILYVEKDIIELVNLYHNHLPDIQFYNDVFSCIEELKNNGMMTGIITDGYFVTQKNKLKALAANHLFDHIIITDTFGREYWKPHPRAFESMKNVLNIDFENMIYVGDNPEKDFYISKFYPIKTVRIIREQSVYTNKSYLGNIREDCRIYNLNKLYNLFDTCL